MDKQMVEIKAQKKGTSLILYVSGRLDTESFESFKVKVGSYIREVRGGCLILNLEGVDYIDSSGLGAIVAVLFSLNKENKKLKVAAASKFVSRIFKVTHFSDIVPIYPDIESALSDNQNV